MSFGEVLEIGRDTIWTTLLLGLPALAISLLVGLVISVVQTITSIQDQTLSSVPRILAVALAIVFTLGWTLQTAIQFFVRMLGHAVEVTR